MQCRGRFKAAASVVVLAAFGLTLAGCAQFGVLKARKAFKEANLLYQQQDYKRAAEKYEEVVGNDPTMSTAYFYLANSYDNLYKPSRKGEAQNDEYLKKAIDGYRKCADGAQTDPKLKKLSLEYLVAAYGPDKMADPAQAVPLIEEMIKIDPSEPTNYFVLAKMYEDAGNYEVAEQQLLKAKEMRPNDSNTYMQLAGFYNRQGEFEKTMNSLAGAGVEGADQPRGVLHHRVVLLGEGLPRLPAEGRGQAQVHRPGPAGVRRGAQAEGRLPRGADLQEPPAPVEGAGRQGPGAAAGAAQGSRPAPRQGDRSPQEEGWRPVRPADPPFLQRILSRAARPDGRAALLAVPAPP